MIAKYCGNCIQTQTDIKALDGLNPMTDKCDRHDSRDQRGS